jgi:AcrR family transcriptional regulator
MTAQAKARAKKPAKKRRVVKTTRAEQRAGTREQIRAAAFELFSTVGFEETTTNAIAQRAGVASGTVFVHASDKPDLLFMVMHDRLETAVNAAFESIPDGPLLERLLHLFGGIFRMYGEHPKMGAAFVRLLPGASGPNAERVNAMTFAFLQRVAALVDDAKTRREVAKDLDAGMCARNIFGLYFMALLTWLSGQVPLEIALDPMLRSSLALQIRGFRP